jgi:hypothetical protein
MQQSEKNNPCDGAKRTWETSKEKMDLRRDFHVALAWRDMTASAFALRHGISEGLVSRIARGANLGQKSRACTGQMRLFIRAAFEDIAAYAAQKSAVIKARAKTVRKKADIDYEGGLS